MYDHLEIRCPKLGGEVVFAYCKKETDDLPCSRILICWQPYFPVETYLRELLSESAWERCFNHPPKEKMTTLIELIEAAKKRKARS
ncbi:MAG: hypothetical protein JRI47_02055 [Deltaproteobacteria bacterium]|nr:hypothetical protein [Deltaproteobacteria bacterium]